MNKLIGGALAALLLQGCASVTPPDYDKLGAELDPLLSQPARDQLPQVLALSEQERLERVDDLLFKTLSPGTAQQLALRLGLEHPAMMELPATLPQLPENDLASPVDLVAHALAQRLDLRIARQYRAVAEHRQALYERPGVFTQLDLGIDVERDRAGDGLIGPSLALGLPLFDRNQARRASADATNRTNRAGLSPRRYPQWPHPGIPLARRRQRVSSDR